MTLREIVHAHIPTLTEQSTVRDAVDKMDIYQFPGLVVVDRDLQPIAVVTEGDIVRAANAKGGVFAIGNDPVIHHASREPRTASVGTEVSDALHLMTSTGVTVLPVTDEGRLAGLVLRVDLMQAILMDSTPVAQ